MIRGYKINSGDSVTPFPLAERIDSEGESIVVDDVDMRAQGGDTYNYENWRVRRWRLKFHLTDANRAFFRALSQAVGRELFYFIPDVDADPVEAVIGRKDKGFVARRITKLSSGGWHEYEFVFTEEPDSAVSVEA